MIKVKALRNSGQQAEKPSRESYVAEEKANSHVWPVVFLVALSGIVTYLKSFLPGSVETPPEQPQKDQPEEHAAPPTQKNVLAEEEKEEDFTGSIGEEPRGSSNVVPISLLRPASSGGFLTLEPAPIDFSRLDRNSVVSLHPAASGDFNPQQSQSGKAADEEEEEEEEEEVMVEVAAAAMTETPSGRLDLTITKLIATGRRGSLDRCGCRTLRDATPFSFRLRRCSQAPLIPKATP